MRKLENESEPDEPAVCAKDKQVGGDVTRGDSAPVGFLEAPTARY